MVSFESLHQCSDVGLLCRTSAGCMVGNDVTMIPFQKSVLWFSKWMEGERAQYL